VSLLGSQIKQLSRRGRHAGWWVGWTTNDRNRFLSAVQIGVTLALSFPQRPLVAAINDQRYVAVHPLDDF
jgi:CBS domain containing-hemolysin-like protein